MYVHAYKHIHLLIHTPIHTHTHTPTCILTICNQERRAAGRLRAGHVQAGGHPAAGALVHLGLEVCVCVCVYVRVCVCMCMRARLPTRSCMSVAEYCPCAPQARRVWVWRAAGRLRGGHVQAGGHPAAGALVHLGLEVCVCVYACMYVCVCMHVCARAWPHARV
jgi:hypothetical protein